MLEQDAKKVGHQLSGDELHQRQTQQFIDVLAPSVIAVGISDPANIGSLFRICDAVKTKELIFVGTQSTNFEKIKKVSRHTSTTLPHRFISTSAFLMMINEFSHLTAIEITSNSEDIYSSTISENTTFIVGGESQGIPEHILQLCSQAIHIPMCGINSSMNVATSLGIVLYEWHRRFRT